MIRGAKFLWDFPIIPQLTPQDKGSAKQVHCPTYLMVELAKLNAK